jgi:hypothetical protein
MYKMGEKKRESEPLRESRKNMREARRKWRQEVKNKTPNRERILDEFIKAQQNARSVIESKEREALSKKFNRFINEGGVKSKSFWDTRRQIIKGNPNIEYELVTEDERTVQDGEEAREYIATYYEDLYQAREASQGYEASTNDIKRIVQEATKPTHNEIMSEISPKEIKEVTKKLKKKKSNGPDDIPNETIIEADDNTREIYRRVFNHKLTTKEKPES